MAVFLFGGQKGGCGKSTLTINLAVYFAHLGIDTVILDTDPQATAANWVNRRNEAIENHKPLAKIHCVQRTGDTKETIRDLKSRYQCVIVDAGGSDSRALRVSMTAVDVAYIPLRASQADLETVSNVCSLIDQSRDFHETLQAFSIITMAPGNPSITEADEATEFLKDYLHLLPLSKIMIGDRKVYRDSMLEGKGVLEMNNLKAKEEILAFGKEAMAHVKIQI